MAECRGSRQLPWWVTCADILCLAAAVLACGVAVTGGGRGQILGVRLSMTSPLRLALLAVLIATIRHAACRRPTLLVRLQRAGGLALAWARGRHRATPHATTTGSSPIAVELLAVGGLMTVLTVAMLSRYATHLHWVPELGDPLFSIWRLAWVAHQLTTDPFRLYDANIFWPERYTLAYSDGMPLTGLAAAPFIWLGASPVVVHNLFVLASFVLSGVTMYLLVRSLVGSPLAATISGVAFAFYPFRYEHLIHIELLSAFWMPLALWALHRTLDDARHRWITGPTVGVAVGAQYLSGMYFGVFLAAFVVVVWAVSGVVRWRRDWAVKPLAAGALLASVVVIPTLVPYVHVRQAVGERAAGEIQRFSAEAADYLAVRHPLPRKEGCNERQVFPGFLIVALAIVAFWPPVSTVRFAYLVGLAFAFDLSLGSNGLSQPLLYEWCLPFRGLRAPARATMLVGFALAVLAGFGAARLLGLLRGRRRSTALAVILCAVILAEPRPERGAVPVPRVPPIYAWFAHSRAQAIVEIPVWYPIADRYLLYSTVHWQPMVNGFSGSIPASYRPIHVAMRAFPDPHSISTLRAYGVSHLVIHEEFLGTAGYRSLIDRLERWSSLSFVHASTDGRFESRIYALLP